MCYCTCVVKYSTVYTIESGNLILLLFSYILENGTQIGKKKLFLPISIQTNQLITFTF